MLAATLASVSGNIVNLLLYFPRLIIALALVCFLWGLIGYFGVVDEKKKGQFKDTMIYGIVGLFVMVSVWGIVNLFIGILLPDSFAPGGSMPNGQVLPAAKAPSSVAENKLA